MNRFSNSILLVALIGIQSCTESSKKNENQHEKIPVDLLTENHITLKKNETFSIQLSENGSIGLSNCWINQLQCQNVEFQNSFYVSGEKEKNGCIGCGGSVFWKFKAINEGIDTIKFKKCPTGPEHKSCLAFQQDSSSYKNLIRYTSSIDKSIIVKISK